MLALTLLAHWMTFTLAYDIVPLIYINENIVEWRESSVASFVQGSCQGRGIVGGKEG